jgi:hypothetical protein
MVAMTLKHIKAASMLPGKHGPGPDLPLLVPEAVKVEGRTRELKAPVLLEANNSNTYRYLKRLVRSMSKFENAVPFAALSLVAGYLVYRGMLKKKKPSFDMQNMN